MPSRSGVTTMTSAARYSAASSARLVRLVQVVHGRRADPAELAVDPAHLALDLLAQPVVVLDPLPARRGDLDHDRLRHVEPALGEQLAERLEPVLDALGVVEPVDAEDDRLRIAELGPDLARPAPAPRGCRPARSISPMSIEIGNAPARTVRPSTSTAERRAGAGPSSWRASRRKFCAPSGGLEADQVGAEQPAQDLGPPRQLHEQLDRRERDVQEEADPQVGPAARAASPAPAAAGSPAPTPSRRARRTRSVGLGEAPVDPRYASHQRRWKTGVSTASWYSGQMVALE